MGRMNSMLGQKIFVWDLIKNATSKGTGHTGVSMLSSMNLDENEYDPTPQSNSNFTVMWIACCSVSNGCCVKPLIFVNRQIGMYKSLPSGSENPRISPYYSVWIEVDGKIYDPYKSLDTNSELPRLGDVEFGISQTERRRGTLIQDKYNMLTPSETLLDAIGVPNEVRKQFPYLLFNNDLYRCGPSDNAICFPNDNSVHEIKVFIQQLRPIGVESVEYRYKIENTTQVKCEPCEYRVYTHVQFQPLKARDPRHDIPRKCTASVFLETKGGINGMGCVGGYEWLGTGNKGGRWWFGDDTTELRSYAVSSKPLSSGLIATIPNISGTWSDTIRLFDVCGNVLAELPVSVNCYEADSVDPNVRRVSVSRI